MSQAYQLGKHMAKLQVEDGGIIILRPRYEMKAEEMKNMLQSMSNWQKRVHGHGVQLMLVPHDVDVFVLDKKQLVEGLKNEEATTIDNTDAGGNDAGSVRRTTAATEESVDATSELHHRAAEGVQPFPTHE